MTIGNAWLGSMAFGPVSTAQAMSLAAFSLQTPILSVPCMVTKVTVQAADMSELLTVAYVPAAGTAYSVVLLAAESSGHSSFVFFPDRPDLIGPGGYYQVDVTNANGTGVTYGNVEVWY